MNKHISETCWYGCFIITKNNKITKYIKKCNDVSVNEPRKSVIDSPDQVSQQYF